MKGISIPLHPSQGDVYVDQLIHTNSAHYNIGGYIKLKGKLDKEKFHQTVHSAAQVFDAFKMRFELDEEKFRCFIDENFSHLSLIEKDFSSVPNAETEAEKWMQDNFNQVFSIQKTRLLFDHALLKISENEHWFFGKYHHLITDGYGFIVFVKYIASKYHSLSLGDNIKFEFPSYTEEANKASAYYESEEYFKDKEYWDNKINEKPAKILQRKYQVNQSPLKTSSTTIIKIDAEKRQRLLSISESINGAGLQQLTLAALLIYFGKITGQTSFHFGIPVHKRSSKRQKNMVGMFSGILLFNGNYEKDQSLTDLLRDINQTQRNDYRHQSYPIGSLSRDLKIHTSDGYLHEVSVNYEPLNFELDFGPDIQAKIARIANENDRNPLQICWREYGNHQGLELHIHYLLEYFNKDEIDLLSNRLLYLMEQFVGNHDQKIGSFQILPDEEKEELNSFNDTQVIFPENKSIIDLFEDQVSKSPNATALIIDKTKISYKELNRQANQIAHFLIKQGVKTDSLVPICIERGVSMVAGIIGILKAGGAYVPIDPEYPLDRINYMIGDCKADIVLSSKTSRSKIDNHNHTVVELDGDWSKINPESNENLGIKLSATQLAYVIYTSGSQGRPKGVMIEHGNVYAFICWSMREFSVNTFDIVYAGTSICFDLSVFEIFYPLSVGKKIRLLENGLYISRYLSEDHSVMTNSVPGVIQSLLLGGADLSAIKIMNMAGEPVPIQVQHNLEYENMVVRNLYGPSEDTTYSTVFRLQKDGPVLIGKPIDNTSIHILGPNDELMPIGVAGEICIGGCGLARGYLNSPELTAAKFIQNPFDKRFGMRLYRTGDLGRWLPDGNLDYLGRIDNQVKIRGFRIELGEIESVIQQSGMCLDAIVLAKEDHYGDKRLVGYAVPKNDFDREIMINFLRERLPDYMIPGIWIELDVLPKTPNGKIDRNSLPEPESDELISNAFEAPANEMEATVTLIWKELLNLNEIGVNDNFFELGGHSLNAIQLTSRLHKILNIQLDVEAIFLHPTIKKLSKILALEKHLQFREIEKLPLQDVYELSHSQKRFWILSHFSDGSEAYNNSNTFIIKGKLNFEAFQKAFESVIDRHEILRTKFVEKDSNVYQKIVSTKEIDFEINRIDLSQMENPDTYIKDWVKNDSKQPFDLSNGPLLRATLFETGKEVYAFAINLHHIISDGWSKRIFTKEVFAFYNMYDKHIENSLQTLPIQYRDYAAWHKSIMEEQGEYWRYLYEDNIPVLNFPTDFPRPKVLSFFGAMLHFQLPESLTNGLKKKAIEYNMSLNNLMVSLYGLLVARMSGQEDVVIGSLSSGRSHLDLENLIGVFINFLPIRLKPKGNLKLGEYLSATQGNMIQAYNHQDYPFDRMVEECIKQRDVSRNPFFDTMVNFHLENALQNRSSWDDLGFDDSGIRIISDQSFQDELFQSVLDFKLDIEPHEKTFNLYLSYNTRLFNEKTMGVFLNRYTELLSLIIESGNITLNELVPMNANQNEHLESTDQKPNTTPLSIYVCSSFVAEPILDAMEYWSNELELNIDVRFAPYNQVFQELLNPLGDLWRNKGINVLFIRPEDWLRDQKNTTPKEQIEFLKETHKELQKALEVVATKLFTPFITGIVPLAKEHTFNEEVASEIQNICSEIEKTTLKYSTFQLIDFDKVAEMYYVDEQFDSTADSLGHMPFTQEYYAALGTFIDRKIRAFRGPVYKVIALDCDNTLWKGICGEVGALGVEIDENFSALQQFMIQKYNEGFLLILCSKNNEADVWEVFDHHPGMLLKREHIAAAGINWQPKSENLKSIAKELNLSTNSFIFVDDTEFEVEQMSMGCPDVLALQLPKETEEFLGFLEHIWEFDQFSVTEEDSKRTQMYHIEKQRKEDLSNFSSINDFIESLKIQVDIYPLKPSEMDRAVQLCMRTNQFNLNGIRKNSEEISSYLNNKKSIYWIIEVKDRFGDYGIVGLLLATPKNDDLNIETFVLSCRVLGRNVEEYILSELQTYCVSNQLKNINCNYESTPKNAPFREFLTRTGWIRDTQSQTFQLPVKLAEQVNAE
jgi:amino acid adenylation domain-containing protein/FkbH-like protein